MNRRQALQFVILVAILAVAGTAARSRAAQGASSEAKAREVLNSAVAALGGADRLSQVQHWFSTGRGRENLTAQLQGIRPDKPTWRSHEETIAVDGRTLGVAWDRRTPRNDMSVRWRRMVFKPDGMGFADWSVNQGMWHASEIPEARRRGYARRIPHLLLLEAATSARSATWTGERRVHGKPADVVAVELADGAKLNLLIGRSPGVLLRAEYNTHMPAMGDIVVGWEWSGWQRHSQIGYAPQRHRVDIAGQTFQELKYSEYSTSAASAENFLQVPEHLLARHTMPAAGSSQAPAPASAPPLPATGEVAPAVTVANISGFNVMFVAFRDFVVAMEAPESDPGFDRIPAAGSRGNITQQFLTLIEKTYPGKPVRYVVISHHHGDHIGGLRAFAAAGATLLVAPGDRPVVERGLAAPHTLLGDTPPPASAKIETVADRRVITDGERRLEVINIGANPHTAENLFVWLPEERIVFQGDLFYYAHGGTFPPSGRGTMNRFFAQWLSDNAINPRAVYGVHNSGAAGPEWLARSLKPDDARSGGD